MSDIFSHTHILEFDADLCKWFSFTCTLGKGNCEEDCVAKCNRDRAFEKAELI